MADIEKMVKQISGKIGAFKVDVAIILGSGWNECLKKVDVKYEINYSEVEGLPTCSVKGHNGKFVFATYNGVNIGVMQGRFHMYEGYTAYETTIGLQVLAGLGAKKCIITNASGSVNRRYKQGDVVVVSDVINLTCRNPLIGIKPTDENPIFIPMGNALNVEMQKIAIGEAKNLKIRHRSGVYAQVLGPNYETTSDIKMLRVLGADCVGMSTVQEIIMARYLKMDVLALAYISNLGQGLSKQVLSHSEVLNSAKFLAENCSDLILNILPKLKLG